MKKFLTITILFLFGLSVWSVGTMLETPPLASAEFWRYWRLSMVRERDRGH